MNPASHHRRSIRLQPYDYTHPGAYFVTICTWQMKHLMGEILVGEMQLNQAGQITRDQWLRLNKRFPQVEPSAFVIMPNHIHGILVISDPPDKSSSPMSRRGAAEPVGNPPSALNRCAPTCDLSPNVIPGLLGAIVRAYKSAVTLRINHLRSSNKTPIWQRNYFEHIIRDETDWENVLAYIQSNPSRWTEDRFCS